MSGKNKTKAEEVIDISIKLSGLGLLIFMLVYHILVEAIAIHIIAIPILMIGLDIREIFQIRK